MEHEGEVSKVSHLNCKYSLKKLICFCEDNDIELATSTASVWRSTSSDDMKGYQKDHAEEQSLNASGIPRVMCVSTTFSKLNEDDRMRDTTLTEWVEDVLDYFYKFEYAR